MICEHGLPPDACSRCGGRRANELLTHIRFLLVLVVSLLTGLMWLVGAVGHRLYP